MGSVRVRVRVRFRVRVMVRISVRIRIRVWVRDRVRLRVRFRVFFLLLKTLKLLSKLNQIIMYKKQLNKIRDHPSHKPKFV